MGIAGILGADGFWVSDLGTLGIACFVADRLWYQTAFPAVTWFVVVALWVGLSCVAALSVSLAPLPRWVTAPWSLRFVGVCACALVVKSLASPFSWRQALAFALLSFSGLCISQVLLGIVSKSRELDSWEGLRFAAAQAVALFAVHPYLRSALLGAGDALSYSMAAADYVTQWRAGIFPVLIGQSPFAFSGGFQPLRNAPLFTHLIGIFDLLGLRTFNAFALQNLAIFASMLGAVLGCYAALRLLLQRTPWLALGLAVLYGLSPGVLAPLYGGDLIITFMALPFVPWLLLGVEQASASPGRLSAWALMGASLAGMWLAHPPVAAWATVLAGFAGAWILVRERRASVITGMLLMLAVLLVLGGYLFVSVASLGLPVVSRTAALSTIDYKMGILRGNWVSSLLPISSQGNNLLGDVQLGYGLWACLILSAGDAVRIKAVRPLLGCFALILVFAWPVPGLTGLAWRILPSELLVMTNQWPIERFYLLLAGTAVFIVGPALARYLSRGPRQEVAVYALLSAACLWSALESAKFFRRAAAIGHSEAASEDLHRPENIVLSRTHSYEYLGTPWYFSNGHMDPRMETRLLDLSASEVFADGSTVLAGSSSANSSAVTVDLHAGEVGVSPESIPISAGETLVLRFDFLGTSPVGELQISAGSLLDFYTLPESGGEKAFGSGIGNGHALIVENTAKEPAQVSIRFVGKANAGSAFARVRAKPLKSQDMVIRVLSLTPFHALVHAERDCYLETPKLFVPGYEARVDGDLTQFVKSPNGLVMVPLRKGDWTVSLAYRGGRLLRLSYFASAAAWLALLGLVASYSIHGKDLFSSWIARTLRATIGVSGRFVIRRKYAFAATIAVALAAAAVTGYELRPIQAAGYGDVRMLVRLPLSAIGQTEPLVTTGHTGAGDFIFITYVDGGHIVVGHDKWAYGGGKSSPVAVDYANSQQLEIDLGSLYRDPSASRKVSIRVNGVTVFSEDATAYPSTRKEVVVGQNTIGGSTTLPRFTGEILRVSRGGEAPGK